MRRIQRKDVIQIVLIELMPLAGPLEHPPHEPVLEPITRHGPRVVQHPQPADKVLAVGVMLDVRDCVFAVCGVRILNMPPLRASGCGDRRDMFSVRIVEVVGGVAECVDFELFE